MPRTSRHFFQTAIIWFAIGISIGMYMGISKNYAFIAAHTHINLLGWVSNALFGVVYTIMPGAAVGRWPRAHYLIYNAGLLLFLPGLYLEGLGSLGLEPIIGIGASLVCLGVVIFAFIVFSTTNSQVRETQRLDND